MTKITFIIMDVNGIYSMSEEYIAGGINGDFSLLFRMK